MPIAGTIHSLPAGVLVTNGQISDATQHNPALSDLSDGITEALTRHGDHITGMDPHSQYMLKANDSYINAIDNGITGSGADESAAIQTFIDANKGKKLLFPADGGRTYFGAGIILSGSTYNDTHLLFEGPFKLKPAATVGTNNFQFVYTGIAFHDNVGCSISGYFDGNRTAQQAREQTMVITVAGVGGIEIPYANIKEIRGDGIYICERTINSSSPPSKNVNIGFVYGENSADDGRNLVSVISGETGTIGTLFSKKIGGTIGGGVMPGGLDFEPDPGQAHHSVKDWTVGEVNVETAGSTGLAIQGYGGNTAGISIGVANIVNTSAPSVADEFTNVTLTNNQLGLIRGAADVWIGSLTARHVNAYGVGLAVNASSRVRVNANVSHCWRGAALGTESEDAFTPDVTITDCNIDIFARDIGRHGIATGKMTRTKISGVVLDPVTTFYSSRFAVFSLFPGGGTQDRCVYSVDIPYHANWSRGYRNDGTNPVTFTNTTIENCDISGAWASFVISKDMPLLAYNVKGHTSRSAIPTNGNHVAGQIVYHSAPTATSAKAWVCTVTGSPGTWVDFTPPATSGSTAMTGTALAGALASYTSGTALGAPSGAYVQAEIQAIITRLNTVEGAVQSNSQKIKRHDDALFTSGILRV